MLLGAPAPSFAQGLTAAWNGYAGVGDYSRSNGNTASVVNAAHAVRDGNYEEKIASATEVDGVYDLVIVGGGFAGLIAAYEFRKTRPTGSCLVLDNHPVFGGEAKQNQMLVDGVMLTGPQGSNDAIVPLADNSYAHGLLLRHPFRVETGVGDRSLVGRPAPRTHFGGGAP